MFHRFVNRKFREYSGPRSEKLVVERNRNQHGQDVYNLINVPANTGIARTSDKPLNLNIEHGQSTFHTESSRDIMELVVHL